MNSNDGGNDATRTELPPKAITERLGTVEEGDELVLNDRDTVFEVIDTDRYSVHVVDRAGNDYTISQNLQTGGWSVHEDVWWVGPADDDGT